jgi:hypothetical protein
MLFLIWPPITRAQAPEVLPPNLRAHAVSIGCRPIAGYYDAPGRERPPYVFGYREPSDQASAAYWCEPGEGGLKSRLVIWLDPSLHVAAPCKPLSWQNPARGLSISREERPLSDFFFVSEPNRKGPPQQTTVGPVIQSEYDGVLEEFYCFNGQWLARQLH